MTIIDRFIYKTAMVFVASINKKGGGGSACVSNLRDLSHYTAKKTAYTMGAAACSVKPDAADLHTALYRQSVHVVFLDSVPEVAEMTTIYGNLQINIYFFKIYIIKTNNYGNRKYLTDVVGKIDTD